jgi:hypothetical protein
MVVWAILYFIIAYRGIKYQYVQMPLILACGNIVWEFLWGFVFQSQYQTGVLIGMGSAFVIDLTIFYGIMRYMKPKMTIPFYRNNLYWLAALGIAVWTFVWWTFKTEGIDTDGGGISGNTLNAIIVVFWLGQLIQINGIGLFSVTVGWLKFIADIAVALFMMSVFPKDYYGYTITWISVFFDALYILVFYLKKTNRWPLIPQTNTI